MTTTIALPALGEPKEGRRGTFAGFEVNVVLDNGKVEWISVESIKRAMPGVEREPAWQRYSEAIIQLRIKVDGDILWKPCVPKRTFWAVTFSHPKAEMFREAVLDLLEALDNNGVAVASKFANDPDIQQVMLLAKTMIEVKELKEGQAAIKGLAVRAIEQSGQALNLAEESLELQRGANGRRLVIPYLSGRGYQFGSKDYGLIGNQMGVIAKKLGDFEYNKPENKRLFMGIDSNMHLQMTFDQWEKEWGSKYKAGCGPTPTGGR